MTTLRFTILLPMLLTILLAGCSSNVKEQTEDSKIAVEAMEQVEGLRAAYESREFSSMARYCTKDLYRSITGSLKSFDSVELTFEHKWVEINRDGDKVETLVAWKGSWKTGKESTNKDGTVLFTLKGKPLKVQGIDRLSPFRQP